jgi:hypothetical protein
VYSPLFCIASRNLRWARPHCPAVTNRSSSPNGQDQTAANWTTSERSHKPTAASATSSPRKPSRALSAPTHPTSTGPRSCASELTSSTARSTSPPGVPAPIQPGRSTEYATGSCSAWTPAPRWITSPLPPPSSTTGASELRSFAAWGPPQPRAALPGWIERIKPRATGWFPSGPAAALFADLKIRPGMQELKASEVAAVCAGLAEQVSAGGIIHNSDPMLATQVSGAVRLHSGDGWRFARCGVDHVDGVYATAGAVHLARTLPLRTRPMVFVSRRNA